MDTTIHGLQDHFALLNDRRNHFVNGSFELRAGHMNRRIGRIADSYRKGERMPGRLSRAVSYFMSCVNYFGGHLDLELGMLEKFPMTGCLYCAHLPCVCTESRPDPTGYRIHDEQRNWTIRQWQAHLKSVYGHYNMGKFPKAFMRLVSEFGELGILNAEGPDTPITPEGKMVECRRESADVFSWILTLAYIEGIDLEQAIVERYETCPGCKRASGCECSLVFISKDGTMFSRVGTPEYMTHQEGD
jgi:hypothetical protein